MKPVEEPLFTHLLAEKWRQQNETPKPTALGTMLRYSGAYGCARKMGYDWFGARPTEPIGLASSWAMGVGTLIHEKLQECIAEVYPSAIFEMPTIHEPYVSGSCDAFVPDVPTYASLLFELKTMGGFAFDQQMGYKRSFGKLARVEGKGPKKGAVAQAGMNALGAEKATGVRIETVVMGSLTFDVVSVKMARQADLTDFGRFGGEWHLSREVWEPLAKAEMARLDWVGSQLAQDSLPDRVARDEDGNVEKLDPFGGNWNCDYCPYRSLCVADGAGEMLASGSHMASAFAA